MKISLIKFVLLIIIIIKSSSKEHIKNFDLSSNNFDIFSSKNDFDSCDYRPELEKSNFYYILPSIKAKIKSFNEIHTFSSKCYSKISVELKQTESNKLTLEISPFSKKKFLCSETFIIHSTNFNKYLTLITTSKQTIILNNISNPEIHDIKINGLKIITFCQPFLTSLFSLIKTIELFIKNPFSTDSHLPEFTEQVNKNLLEYFTKRTFIETKNNTNLDEKFIESGDFIGISRLDGIGGMVMLGTGGYINHAAMALWIENELYVIESADGGCWPFKGIQKNLYKDWIKYANNADYNVVVLKLRKDLRKLFNVNKVIEWYKSVEGLNYGYHNFLFTWIDDIEGNLPFKTDHSLIEFVFSYVNYFSSDLANKILNEALNKRLNTSNLKLNESIIYASSLNISFEELIAMPEKDEYVYSDGPNYVCSALAAMIYKIGGLFEGYEVNAHEFTPKDIYMLKFWENSFEGCKENNKGFCQIMGKYKIDLPQFNTIEVYSHMNEKCRTEMPDYERKKGC